MKHAPSLACALLLTVMAGPALAHPGHMGSGGFAAGLAHPLLGLDHLLAMTALGLWAAMRRGGLALLPIASFMGAMAIGALAVHWPAAPLAAVEPMVMASVILLGLLVAAAARLPTWAACLAAATFGLAHGGAHGLEGPAGPAFVHYALGMLLATGCLHAAGFLAGMGLGRLERPAIARALGAATALGGVGLVLAGVQP